MSEQDTEPLQFYKEIGSIVYKCLGVVYTCILTNIQFGLHNCFKICGRHRVIRDKDTQEAYLERYYVFLRERGEKFPCNVFVHKFLKSDPDDLHDHPWPYFTWILKGGYWEHTPEGRYWRKPCSCRVGKATDLHRIELDPEKDDCWTLFIPGKKEREWGFVTEDGWIHHDSYVNKKVD